MTVIATCHCGGTRIEIDAAPAHATACTCSYCSKVGALWVYSPLGEARVVAEAHPGIYSKSGYNEHHFCARCGVTTHSINPDWSLGDTSPPDKKNFALNARLLDGVDIAGIEVRVIDGKNLW